MNIIRHAALALALMACGCVNEPLSETYEIFPRSISLLDSGKDSVRLFVSMYIGSDLCHQYSGYRSSLNRATQSVQFFATRPTPAANATCFAALAHLQDTLAIARLSGVDRLDLKLESGRDTLIQLDE
jgi:hypothetical protein